MENGPAARGGISSAHDVYLGFDVGKGSHWACALKGGEAVVDRAVENRRGDVRAAIEEAMGHAGGLGVLVTVDQRNNIGSLVVREARDMGCDVAYLPGHAESRAREMYPRLAKDDRLDAWVIAHTSEASPQALLPVPDPRAARLLGSQRRHCVKLATQARNRLHAVLLEGDPELEAACDLSDGWLLGVLSELGGAAGIAGCGRRRYNSVAGRHGAPRDGADALRGLAELSVRRGFHPEGEDGCVRWLAAEILRADAEAERLEAEASSMLAGDECYRCLLTIPGIGHVSAEALVSLVDISLFATHDQLASFCGLAPKNSRSGTSVDHAAAQRSGNKELKNLLIFTVNSVVGTDSHFGRLYDRVLARSSGDPRLKRKKALKAVARKRLKVVFAVMRDLVPYDPSRWEDAA